MTKASTGLHDTLLHSANPLRSELDYIFAVPTRRHMSYQCGEVLPYWIKTQILRKKGLTPPRLYKFNDDAADVDKVIGRGKFGTMRASIGEKTEA